MKLLRKIILVIMIILLLAVTGFIIWANQASQAEQSKLDIVLNDPNISITESKNYYKLTSTACKIQESNCSIRSLIYYPGAKVSPKAYFYKLSELVKDTIVFVTKPILNLALFSINAADEILNDPINKSITHWALGGHSLGGSMACEYIKNKSDKYKALILVGAYCASDISKSNLKVLLLIGTKDGLMKTDVIQKNSPNLPVNAKTQYIKGMNHAQAGNYGEQSGDLKADIEDEEVKTIIIDNINKAFL
jgi:hypothetical protein